MGIYTLITFTSAIFKKDRNFFLSFILYLNIFVNFKTIQYYKTCNLFYTIISYIPQIH